MVADAEIIRKKTGFRLMQKLGAADKSAKQEI